MGSYSAPAFSLGYHKAVHDNTSSDGDVLIDPVRCVDFMARYMSSVLYDGDCYVELQKADGSYFQFLHATPTNEQWVVLSPQARATAMNNTPVTYPYIVRVVGTTKPTQGLNIIHLITQPVPANPLF